MVEPEKQNFATRAAIITIAAQPPRVAPRIIGTFEELREDEQTLVSVGHERVDDVRKVIAGTDP